MFSHDLQHSIFILCLFQSGTVAAVKCIWDVESKYLCKAQARKKGPNFQIAKTPGKKLANNLKLQEKVIHKTLKEKKNQTNPHFIPLFLLSSSSCSQTFSLLLSYINYCFSNYGRKELNTCQCLVQTIKCNIKVMIEGIKVKLV